MRDYVYLRKQKTEWLKQHELIQEGAKERDKNKIKPESCNAFIYLSCSVHMVSEIDTSAHKVRKTRHSSNCPILNVAE